MTARSRLACLAHVVGALHQYRIRLVRLYQALRPV